MNKRLFGLFILLAVASFMGQCFLYPSLPPKIPLQWDVFGRMAGTGNKWVALLIAALPALILIGMQAQTPTQKTIKSMAGPIPLWPVCWRCAWGLFRG
ncbi:DUF1648 domain-containing protein [Ruminococcaceae bacterium OttesenSCG-928-A16]|nr:DUF1648 domain-containing protein [Ruminococcaceae bacterium OttesenSCG-928-A16]